MRSFSLYYILYTFYILLLHAVVDSPHIFMRSFSRYTYSPILLHALEDSQAQAALTSAVAALGDAFDAAAGGSFARFDTLVSVRMIVL